MEHLAVNTEQPKADEFAREDIRAALGQIYKGYGLQEFSDGDIEVFRLISSDFHTCHLEWASLMMRWWGLNGPRYTFNPTVRSYVDPLPQERVGWAESIAMLQRFIRASAGHEGTLQPGIAQLSLASCKAWLYFLQDDIEACAGVVWSAFRDFLPGGLQARPLPPTPPFDARAKEIQTRIYGEAGRLLVGLHGSVGMEGPTYWTDLKPGVRVKVKVKVRITRHDEMQGMSLVEFKAEIHRVNRKGETVKYAKLNNDAEVMDAIAFHCSPADAENLLALLPKFEGQTIGDPEFI